MNKADVLRSVVEEIASVLDKPISDIDPTMDLSDELGADSLDIMDIVHLLSDKFDVPLHREDWTIFSNVTAEIIVNKICGLKVIEAQQSPKVA